MWHSRLPLFAPGPAIPDFGMTLNDWFTVALTFAIALAAWRQVVVNRRLLALQHSIEDERKRMHIVLEFVKRDDGPALKVMNASVRGVYIGFFRLTLVNLPGGQKSWNDKDGLLLGRYDFEELSYRIKWNVYIVPLLGALPPVGMVLRLNIFATYEDDGQWHRSREFGFEVTVDSGGRIMEIEPILSYRLSSG